MSTAANAAAREAEELEDQLDVAVARLAAIESVLEEVVPFSMFDRLHEGGQPLQVWREYRGFAVADLAARSGVDAAIIEGIETGLVEPVLSVAARLAGSLDIEVSSLVPWRQD